MANLNFREEIKRLDVAERILLAEEIWDSILENQEAVTVSKAQKDELERRLESYARTPEEGSSWQEVKARVQKSK
jgi:putative addiction module component (TIGR02574 family)